MDGVPQKFECNHCSGCVTDFATIGHSYVWGVSPTGPYHYNKTGGWMERIPDVRRSILHCSSASYLLHGIGVLYKPGCKCQVKKDTIRAALT